MDKLRKVTSWLSITNKKSDDGRDQWPSRTAFILASVGGAVGMGNIIRFPSAVFNNFGLQWFIPYLIAIFFLAIPGLILEVSIGQAYRGGAVVAFNNMNRRLKGVGMASVLVSCTVVVYFVIILSWIMIFFRHSFISPLPWSDGKGEEFYYNQVLRQVDPIPGNFSQGGGEVLSYTEYPGTGMLGEQVGWVAFTWFAVWLCMFNGVGMTGRAAYFTMGLPVIMTIILIGRSVSLENAGRGIKLYFATWDGDQLARGQIWQTAVGQVFFSTGVGFGYYVAYASYNSKYANAVQDAFIIVCSNCSFETIAAFAVFGAVGYLGIEPSNAPRLGSFEIGFLTYPSAIAAMPGANFWAVFFFLTLMLLGVSSTYPMLDTVVTLIMDAWGHKVSRPVVATSLVVTSFLLSLMYCTQFGYYLLDGVDRWVNNIALVFVVWSECVGATTVYRYWDVVGQVGWPAFIVWNIGYFGAMIAGVSVGQAVSPLAGAGAGFNLFIVCAVVSSAIAQTPDVRPPKLWGRSAIVSRFWYLAFYSGNQLRRDLNVIVGTGKNWKIPSFWAPLLRYISTPTLAIVLSFAYPEFYTLRNDPVYIFGFIVTHFISLAALLGFVVPKWFDVFVPSTRRGEGSKLYAPNVVIGGEDAEGLEVVEEGKASPTAKTQGLDT